MLITFLNIIFVVTSLFLILVIMLQPGKGGSMASTFGGATSQQVFGGRGASSLLEQLTTGATVIFMGLALLLAYLGIHSGDVKSLQDKENQQIRVEAEENARKLIEQQADAQKKAASSVSSVPAPTSVTTPGVPATIPTVTEPTQPKADPVKDSASAPPATAPKEVSPAATPDAAPKAAEPTAPTPEAAPNAATPTATPEAVPTGSATPAEPAKAEPKL